MNSLPPTQLISASKDLKTTASSPEEPSMEIETDKTAGTKRPHSATTETSGMEDRVSADNLMSDQPSTGLDGNFIMSKAGRKKKKSKQAKSPAQDERTEAQVWQDLDYEVISSPGSYPLNLKQFRSLMDVTLRVNNTTSEPIQLENGVPIRSVLSVVLFLMTINDIFDSIERPLWANMFADDLTILGRGKDVKILEELIQATLDKLLTWSERTGFKFSDTKTEYMLFTRGHQSEEICLTLGGHPIKRVYSLKILGMIHDPKLSWKKHIETVKSIGYKRLNIIKSLASTVWGAEKNCLLTTYKALIRQKIEYGAIIYDSAHPHVLKALETLQNSALRISLGAYRTSPVTSLLAEALEVPLSLRRKELVMTYAAKKRMSPDNPVKECIFRTSTVDANYSQRPTLPNPLRIRLKKYSNEFNLELSCECMDIGRPGPPWFNLSKLINLELAENPRKDTPSLAFRNLFLELKNKYEHHEEYYTDGSKKWSFIQVTPGSGIHHRKFPAVLLIKNRPGSPI
ncbi:Protein of unknown function [Cotesia congregata]|uniref:Reverse transcriptase domain-containing protein n=1 Tax=Cotesia congregata TaxID=51543 RepID=A0A8J2HB31_COTCN|nr:Protein of unknown function [Cotesia congregata]